MALFPTVSSWRSTLPIPCLRCYAPRKLESCALVPVRIRISKPTSSSLFSQSEQGQGQQQPAPDTATDTTASKSISNLWLGVSLVRNLADVVHQHHKKNNSTRSSSSSSSTKAATRTAASFPEWMQPLWENLPGENTNNKRRTRPRYRGSWMQRSAALQALSTWAFEHCDAASDGRINRDELYAGILLVHLNLAKYIGVTACNPLNRTQVDELFHLAAEHDAWSLIDGRQTIGREAFGEIVVLSCAKITSRILVYYSLLVLFVPFLTRRIIGLWQQSTHAFSSFVVGRKWHFASSSTSSALHLWALAEWTVQHFLSLLVVTTVMPWIFVKLQAWAPTQWMLPRRNDWLFGKRKRNGASPNKQKDKERQKKPTAEKQSKEDG